MSYITLKDALEVREAWMPGFQHPLPFLEKCVERKIIRVNDEGLFHEEDVTFVADWFCKLSNFQRGLFVTFFDYEDEDSQDPWFTELKREMDTERLKEKLAQKIVDIRTKNVKERRSRRFFGGK